PRLEHAGSRVARHDLRRLQQMVATALRLLAEGARAAETLAPHFREKQLLVHQRRVEHRILLLPFQRHPVAPFGVKQIEPSLPLHRIEQIGLAIDEVGNRLLGDHSAASTRLSMSMVMNFAQSWNWLRIWPSEVPLITAVTSCSSSLS